MIVAAGVLELDSMRGTERIPLRTIRRVSLGVLGAAEPSLRIETADREFTLGWLGDQSIAIYEALVSAQCRLSAVDASMPTVHEFIELRGRFARYWLASATAMAVLTLLPVVNGGVLRWAAWRGASETVDTLMALHLPTDVRNSKGETALYLASKAGRIDIVRSLIARGADLERPQNSAAFTPLHVAAEYGRVEVIQALLDAGADPNSRNKWQQTPLWQLSWKRLPLATRCAELLANAGADLNAADSAGFTPVHMAARYGDVPLLEWLAARGADLDQLTAVGRQSALHHVTTSGDVAVARKLIALGAGLDVLDGRGHTALTIAIYFRHTAIALALIEAGARFDSAGLGTENALQLAAESGNLAVLRSMLDHGVDPDAPIEPQTPPPLYLAVNGGHDEAVRVLLDAGADPSAPFKGWTPLRLARDRHQQHVETLLRAYGAQK